MKYLFFLLLPLAYLAGNVYLFFRGKAAFAAQSTGVKVLLLIIFLCCALAFFGAFFLRELHLPSTMAQLIEQIGTGWLVFTLYMVIALLLSFGLGLFIFFVYKKTYAGVMYSASFGGTLVALTMITSMVILAVTSNVVLSLGMVGALSIVRFRTAIKEPLDIAFLFWAIAAGIVLSAGMIPLAVFGSVVIGLVMLLFMNRKSKDNPFIAVISCRDYEAEKRAAEYLNKHVKKADIKSKTAQEGNIELNYEIRLLSDDTDFITELSQLEGVNSAVLVSYNGDYMG